MTDAPDTREPTFVLASQSPRRRQLLLEAGYRFTVMVPPLEEPPATAAALTPSQHAESLAYFKARAVMERYRPNLPVLGNAGFSIALSQALPNSAAVLLLTTAPSPLPIGGGCTLYLGPAFLGAAVATDGNGNGTVPLGIPNDPVLLGGSLAFQWGVLDAGGAYLGQLSFSAGLDVLIGD